MYNVNRLLELYDGLYTTKLAEEDLGVVNEFMDNHLPPPEDTTSLGFAIFVNTFIRHSPRLHYTESGKDTFNKLMNGQFNNSIINNIAGSMINYELD
jgi:hypothetical protein